MALDGPIPVMLRDANGDLTDTPAPGVHYNADPATFAANELLLEPFLVSPTRLQRVWAGDDPDAYTMTVPLKFADQAEADAVAAQVK